MDDRTRKQLLEMNSTLAELTKGFCVDRRQPDTDTKYWAPRSKNEALNHYDLTDGRLARRKKAILKYYDIANQRFGHYYKHNGEFLENFSRINFLLGKGGYNYTDSMYYISTAAAIWILDQLKSQRNIESVYDCLPQDVLTGQDITHIPIFEYPGIDSELIKQITALIIRRDEGLYDRHGQDSVSLVDEWCINLKRTMTEKARYRSNFEKVMQLIDKNAIMKTISRCEEKIWQAYDMAFMVQSKYQNKVHVITKELEQLEKEKRIYISKKNSSQNNVIPGPWATCGILAAEMNKKNQGVSFIDDTELRDIQKKICECESQIERMTKKEGSVYSNILLPNSREKRLDKMKDILTDKQYQYISDFMLDDPYEYAFALLYLIDTNSDLPWLYYGGLAVLYQIEDEIPFNTMNASIPRERIVQPSINSYLYTPRFSGSHYPNEQDSEGKYVNRRKCRNIAQEIYAQTFTVMPRSSFYDKYDISMFEESESESNLLRLLFGVGNECFLQSMQHEFNKITEAEADNNDEDVKDDVFIADDAENKELRKKVKELEQLLHESKRQINKINTKLQDTTNEKESLRKQVGDLRSIVFNKESTGFDNEDLLTKPDDTPYHTKLKTISFGGHEAWLKAIKPLLPDVRFISPDMLPNSSLIKHADIIWIQCNCLSHADFYRIINVIRENNLQIRYFTSNSAASCAQQLIQNDMKCKI